LRDEKRYLMVINLVNFQDRIDELKSDKIFESVNLTYEQQTYERGKPKKYLKLASDIFPAIPGS